MPFAYDLNKEAKKAPPPPAASAPPGGAPPNLSWSQLATGGRPGRSVETDHPEQEAAKQAAAVAAMAEFEKQGPYEAKNFRPPTGSGFFDATYANGVLSVVVRCEFDFVDRHPSEFSRPNDPIQQNEVKWDRGKGANDRNSETGKWKTEFLAQVSQFWNNKPFSMYSTRPYWDAKVAQVDVQFVEAGEGSGPKHFLVTVDKVPDGLRSKGVTTYNPITGYGTMQIDSHALEARRKDSGNYQRTAVHESTHVFGLGDTYVEKQDPSSLIKRPETPSHSHLVQKELGRPEVRRDDRRITSTGEALGLAEGVTFLEALRKATKTQDWSLIPNRPRWRSFVPDEPPPLPRNLA